MPESASSGTASHSASPLHFLKGSLQSAQYALLILHPPYSSRLIHIAGRTAPHPSELTHISPRSPKHKLPSGSTTGTVSYRRYPWDRSHQYAYPSFRRLALSAMAAAAGVGLHALTPSDGKYSFASLIVSKNALSSVGQKKLLFCLIFFSVSIVTTGIILLSSGENAVLIKVLFSHRRSVHVSHVTSVSFVLNG